VRIRLAAACALPGGRCVSSTVARSFHLVLAFTSQNFTAANCTVGTRDSSVGRSGATRGGNRDEQRS
jgi:hypothetical protein